MSGCRGALKSDQLIPVFIPEADRERLEAKIKEFRKEVFHRDYMPRIVSFAKARELLMRVKKSGRKILLATSSDKKDVAIYKRIVGMDDLVEEEATSADAQASKPEPDIFAATLKKAAEEAVALGDTPYDAQAAVALGIRVIGFVFSS